MQESAIPPTVEVGELLTQLHAATDTDPALQAHAEQCIEEFARTLGRLSPKVRATFVLHRHYGMTLQEISRELGISFPMAKKYLVKALCQVRQHLDAKLAGALAKRLSRQYGLMTPVRLYESSMLLASVPLLLQLVATSLREACVLLGMQMTFVTFGTALTPTLLQDISPAPLRGRVIALLTFAYSLVSAVSPVLVGGLSDELSSSSRGLLLALLAVSVPAVLDDTLRRARQCPLDKGALAQSATASKYEETLIARSR